MKLSVGFFSLLLTAILLPAAAGAKQIEWASKVIAVSSEYHPEIHGAWQVLGEPNVLPTGGTSPYAWRVAAAYNEVESTAPATINLGYTTPMRIRQVAVAENFNPGAVESIVLLGTKGERREVYRATPKAASVRARMLTVTFTMTDFLVSSVQITLQPSAVPGWNEIDAVAISDVTDPVMATIGTIPNLRFTSKPQNLGRGVNTTYDDVMPRISPDGSTLYFTRKNSPENIGGAQDGDDIWFSTLVQGSWGTARNIGPPLNNASVNYVCSITPDGNTLLIGNVYDEDGAMRGGVSISNRTADGWSFPREQVIENFYNSGQYSEYALSNNGKVLLMALGRNDSYGRRDLYVSFLESEGRWSKPLNMGSDVNSVGEEITPFLAADETTLYFSTDGRSGYGNSDIFMTRRLDSTWTHWSRPQNLGPGINSDDWDAYYTLPASGDFAYYVSEKGSIGSGDIFRIALPEEARPRPVVLVSGKVVDARSGNPVEARIVYELLPGGTEVGIARSDPRDGSYRIVLPSGARYGFRAEAPGFAPVNQNLDVTALKKYTEIEKNLLLVPLEAGQTVVLNNIFFETGKADLQDASRAELARVVQMLEANPNMTIEVSGHTDNVGAAASNLTLSRNRAARVADYLVEHGIARARITSKGYGQTRPVAENTSDAGREKNRRVEFTIIKR